MILLLHGVGNSTNNIISTAKVLKDLAITFYSPAQPIKGILKNVVKVDFEFCQKSAQESDLGGDGGGDDGKYMYIR